MNHFIKNQQGWKALLVLPGLACSGFSYAAPDLQGKFTHESVTLENGTPERHNRNEPLLLRLPANVGYQVENGVDVDNFKIYHTLPDNNQYVLNLNFDSDLPSDAISSSNSGYLEITIPDEWESGLHCFSAAAMSGGVEGGRSAQQCVTLYSQASNLFKTGALTDQPTHLSTSMCLPKGIYSKWHKEIYSSATSTASRNGHILGVSKRSFAVDGKLTYQLDGGGTKRCELEDTDVDTLLGPKYDDNGNVILDADGNLVLEVKSRTRRVRVTQDAREIVHLEADEKNAMLYVKTHACARNGDNLENAFNCLAASNNRAEVSYDSKNDTDAVYTDGLTHTQQGDVFWVTYRFNAVSLFEDGVYDPNKTEDKYHTPGDPDYDPTLVDEGSYVHLSQFHPNTATLPAYDSNTQSDKDCSPKEEGNPFYNVCGHAPSFSILLTPVIENNSIDPNQAWLHFRTKHIVDTNDGTRASVPNLGKAVKIDLRKWYQIKIGIKFSTEVDGWAVAAFRPDGGTWQYFKEEGVPAGSGSLFEGQTLHAPPCRYENINGIVSHGPIGADCVSDYQKHFETVFKFGGYFNSNLWKGSVDRHLEILFDDIYAFDSHHEPTSNEWPNDLGASNDPLKNHADIKNNNSFIPKTLEQTVETYPAPCTNAQCN